MLSSFISAISSSIVCYGAAVSIFLLFIVLVWLRGEKLPNLRPWVLIVVFLALAALRIRVALLTNGYKIDIAWFTNWCINLQSLPFKNVYKYGFYVNYQPTYLYCFWLIGKIGSSFGTIPSALVDPWSETLRPFGSAWVLTLKSIPMLSDALLAYLAYFVASRTSGRKTGIVAALLIMLCPAMGADSLLWGQIDSFLMLLIVLACISLGCALYEKNPLLWVPASILYTLAILTKPQAIIFAPIFLAAVVWHFDIKSFALAVISMIVAVLIVCLPFSEGNVFVWLIKQIKETSMQYKTITLNAYNTYFLVGLNFKEEVSPIWNYIKFVIPGFLTLLTIFLWRVAIISSKERSLSKILTFIFFLGFLVMFSVFMFMPEMHERYSYPALICAYFAYAASGRRKILPIIAAISITLSANLVWLVSFIKLGGGDWESIRSFFSSTHNIGEMFSFVNLVAIVYAALITWSVLKDYKLKLPNWRKA